MKTEQELLLLHDARHLHDGDGEAVDGRGEHGRGQRQVVLVQELCGVGTSGFQPNETKWCNRRALVLQMSGALTLQHKLLHLDLVELVGADDDAVAGQVDAAAGLQGFDLLRDEIGRALPLKYKAPRIHPAGGRGQVGLTLRMQYLLRLSL